MPGTGWPTIPRTCEPAIRMRQAAHHSAHPKRGTNNPHPVRGKSPFHLVRRRQGGMPRSVQNEGLEGAHGRHQSEQRSRLVVHVRPGMRKVARSKQRIAWAKPERLLTDLESELPFDDVEPLILLEMDMPWWTALAHVAVFEQQHFASGIPT